MKDAIFALTWLAAFGITLLLPWLAYAWVDPHRELPTRKMLGLGSVFVVVAFFVMAGMLTIIRTFFPTW